MNNDVFESKMRSLEYFHNLKLLPETYTVIRVDGRSFSNFTYNSKFDKPFDLTFHSWMVETTRRRLLVDEDLPMKDEYSVFIEKLLK